MNELDGFVENGAKALDKAVPNWHKKINIEELDMSNCWHCIIGQLDVNYVFSRLFDDPNSEQRRAYGLTIFNHYQGLEWGYLRELWIKQINIRLKEDSK